MASVFVGSGPGDKAHHNHHHHHHHQRHHVSSKNMIKTSCVEGDHQASGSLPKCVCAPATHAGSFKCRLHRVNNGHSSPSAPTSDAPDSSRTVDAM